jgi:hypothetical protein
MDALGFKFPFDRGRCHPGIAAEEDRRVRKPTAQRPQHVAQVIDDAGRTRISARTQTRPQQESGASFKPHERVIHVLVVPAMKERELLRPMRRIIRAVEIEDEIRGVLVGAVGVSTEPVDARPRQALNRGPLDRILQARERRLRAERCAAIGGDHLKRGIVAEPVGVVDILVSGRDLIQPLADERGQVVRDIAHISRVGDPVDHIRTEPQLLIEFPHEQQAGIRRERAAGEIDDEFGLESEAKLAITLCSHRTSCVGRLSRPEHRESSTTLSRAMAFLRTHS